jgi:hypothetical protein
MASTTGRTGTSQSLERGLVIPSSYQADRPLIGAAGAISESLGYRP